MHARTRLQIMVMTVTRYPNFWPVKLTLEVRKIFVLMNPNRKELQVFCFLPIISILVKGTSAESSHPTVAAPPHIQLLAVGSKSRNNIVTHAVKCYTLALSYTLSQTYIYTLSHAITFTGFFLCQTTFQRNVAQSREMWPEMWPIML